MVFGVSDGVIPPDARIPLRIDQIADYALITLAGQVMCHAQIVYSGAFAERAPDVFCPIAWTVPAAAG